MIEIVQGPSVAPVVAKWVMERCGEDINPQSLGPFQAFGIMQTEPGQPPKAIAGVIYNWYREMPHGSDMRVIIASDSPKWCLPGVLRALFSYPFEHAGCQRLTAVIRDGNEESIRLCRGLGFQREGVLRRGYDGRTNALIFGLLRQECKWIRPRVLRSGGIGNNAGQSARAPVRAAPGTRAPARTGQPASGRSLS